jgi:hypothetical protein
VSGLSQAELELLPQLVPLAAKPSLGQVTALPVQFSSTSQASTAARHTTLDVASASAGQATLVPSQVSATSHTSAAARHWVPLGLRLGKQVPEPLQVSASSQASLE